MEIIEGPEYHTRELILYWMLPDLVVADMEQLLILLFAYSTVNLPRPQIRTTKSKTRAGWY